MDGLRIARYFAWGLLLTPAALVLIWLMIRFCPGLASFLFGVFTNGLGQIDIFSLASEILNNMLSKSHVTFADYLACFPVLLLSALSDSMIIACCIFFVKSLYTGFSNKARGRFTKPVWLLVLAGVILGVIMCSVKGAAAANAKVIVMLVTCLACYIGGLVIMLSGFRFGGSNTYRNRWAGFLINMLTGIVSDVWDALCGVFIATTLMATGFFVEGGGNAPACVGFLLLSAGLLFLKNVVMDAIRPQNV